MARCLIIGCGCRGAALARALMGDGHAVRATTRRRERVEELRALGVEPVLGDPDRVGTLVRALDHVSLAYILLGSAVADGEQQAVLHSTRLDMLLSKMLDSTVRGIVYEAAGSVPGPVLAAGAQRVRAFCDDSRVPHAILTTDPGDAEAWVSEAARAGRATLDAR